MNIRVYFQNNESPDFSLYAVLKHLCNLKAISPQAYTPVMWNEIRVIREVKIFTTTRKITTMKYRCRFRYVFVHKEMNDSSLPFRRLLQR